MIYTRTPISSLMSNEANYLEHFVPIVIFLYLFYRIRTERLEGLFCTPMLGFD
jgi:hypothetical protein